MIGLFELFLMTILFPTSEMLAVENPISTCNRFFQYSLIARMVESTAPQAAIASTFLSHSNRAVILISLTPWLTGAGSRRLEGTNIGHQNREAIAYVGVRVEPTVRLGREVEELATNQIL